MNSGFPAPAVRRWAAVVGAVAAAANAVAPTQAGVTYLSGTAKYRHTLASGGTTINTSDSGIPSEANLSGVGFTLNSTQGLSGGGSTLGKARIGFIANSTTASISIKPGSGITQSDPAGTNAFSETRIDIEDATALKWDATSPGFGPPSTRYVSFTVAGTIGAGGFARCYINLAWYKNSVSGGNSLGGVTLDTGTLTTAGAFSQVLTASSSLSGSTLTTGTDILMIGTILFQANNHASPSDLFPVDSALGYSNSGPVITFVGEPGPALDWLAPINWNTNNTISSPPQEAGDRAYLPNDQGVPRQITLDAPISLGVLESNGSAQTTIQDAGVGRINLDNLGNARAMVWQRSINGDAGLVLNVPVSLLSAQTELLNDSANPIVFNGGVSTASQSGALLVKTGQGPVHLGGPQQHPAGAKFVVEQGTLRLNGDVGFGGGTATQLSELHVGTAGTVGSAVLAAPQRLAVLHLGADGLAVSQAPGKAASATRNLAIDTGDPGTAQLDLRDDGLAVRVDPGQPTPLPAIVGLIQGGYAGGAWDGEGIVSSLAAMGSNGTAIGYAAAAQIGSPPTFMGQVVDGNDVLVRYTLSGDANLDAVVGLADFSILASNFNSIGGWAAGDSDYNLQVTLADFALLAANFNRALPAEPARLSVPEPASSSAVAAGLVAIWPRPGRSRGRR